MRMFREVGIQNQKEKTRNTVSLLKKLFNRTAVQSYSHRGADSWVAGVRVNATSVARVRNLQVSVFSPAGSPRVLHLEVTTAVAHGENSVIKVGAATARQDAAGVQLESHLVCLNCNRHRASLDGGLQRAGALANALVAGDS